MLNFNFLGKGLGIVSLPHFMYDFSRKIFLMLYSINCPSFIVWVPLLLETLGNMCISIVCFPGRNVTNFGIGLIFLIKPFPYMTEKVKTKILIPWGQKELLRWNKKRFSKTKIIFTGLSVHFLAIYSDLLSKDHLQSNEDYFEDGLWKVSPNI